MQLAASAHRLHVAATEQKSAAGAKEKETSKDKEASVSTGAVVLWGRIFQAVLLAALPPPKSPADPPSWKTWTEMVATRNSLVWKLVLRFAPTPELRTSLADAIKHTNLTVSTTPPPPLPVACPIF